MKQPILIRYDEIALKGNNRNVFIRQLVNNIQAQTGAKKNDISVSPGRIYLTPTMTYEVIVKSLKRVFGISSFSPTHTCASDMGAIEKLAQELIAEEDTTSFKVETRREDKTFPKNSMEISAEIGEKILEKHPHRTVDVHNPETTLSIEIRGKSTFLYTEKIPGPGGLPVGTGGNALVLLSGGIDSPVAIWRLLKRGMNVDAIYFHAPPYTGEKTKEKVTEIARVLAEWKPTPLTLHTIHITKILEAIKKDAPEPLTTILQRRFMYHIAEKIAKEKKYQALGTGEAIGQVASQTIENIQCTQAATDMVILRPLIGMDKREIIDTAQKIGTYKLSILPHDDCCHLFAPQNPATKARLEKVKNAEEKLDIETLTQNALETIEMEEIE